MTSTEANKTSEIVFNGTEVTTTSSTTMTTTNRQVILASPEHDGQIVEMLNKGFMDDPLSVYFWPDASLRPFGHRAMFTSYLENQRVADGGGFVSVLVEEGKVKAASIWNTSDTSFRCRANIILNALKFLGAREGYKWYRSYHVELHRCCSVMFEEMKRVVGVADEAEIASPDFIGVDAESQGKGYGSDIMRDALNRCEELGKTVFIFTSNPKNHNFYRRNGFKKKCERNFNGVTLSGFAKKSVKIHFT